MFGKMLEETMAKKKIKVKDLSILSDITEGYISDIRKGKAIPRLPKFKAILESLNLTAEEKENMTNVWEKESSPETFVKKYEILEEKVKNYEEILKNVPKNDLLEQLKIQKNINLKLEKEKNECILYKQLFEMMSEEDKKYTLKNILRAIESEMREQGIYQENKKEIEKLKKEILKEI